MITVAAVGDVHLDEEMRGRYRQRLGGLADGVDVLLLAGDLTKHGTVGEGRVVVEEFRDLPVPVVAVLGNHDYQSDAQDKITELMRAAGITVLEGEGTVVDCPGGRLGVAGVKGFAMGFAGKCASEFGEPEMKSFVRHARVAAEKLREAFTTLEADTTVALTHYSPVKDTLANLRETDAFCINVVTERQMVQMNASSGEHPPEVDEFDIAGVEAAEASLVSAPYVAL